MTKYYKAEGTLIAINQKTKQVIVLSNVHEKLQIVTLRILIMPIYCLGVANKTEITVEEFDRLRSVYMSTIGLFEE